MIVCLKICVFFSEFEALCFFCEFEYLCFFLSLLRKIEVRCVEDSLTS